MADELEINKGGVVSLIDNHELGEILRSSAGQTG